jgi:hypothetical protein
MAYPKDCPVGTSSMFFVKCHKNTTKNIQKSQTKENYNIVTA